MDAQTLMTGSVGGISVAALFGLAVVVYKVVNHRRCRSVCCDKRMEVSLDIDTTTPTGNTTPPKSNPLIKDGYQAS